MNLSVWSLLTGQWQTIYNSSNNSPRGTITVRLAQNTVNLSVEGLVQTVMGTKTSSSHSETVVRILLPYCCT